MGGAGNDLLDAGVGDAKAIQAGNDTLNGGSGNDILNGRGGNDILRGGSDGDTLRDGGGNDRLFGEGGNDLISISGQGTADGGTGGDRITVQADRGMTVTANGGDGNDTLRALEGPGEFRLNGGNGNDLITMLDDDGARLGTGILKGDAGMDILVGNRLDNYLFGGADNDTLRGMEGTTNSMAVPATTFSTEVQAAISAPLAAVTTTS